MHPTQDLINECREILEKEYGRKLSDEEACEAATNLANWVELSFDFWLKDKKRKQVNQF